MKTKYEFHCVRVQEHKKLTKAQKQAERLQESKLYAHKNRITLRHAQRRVAVNAQLRRLAAKKAAITRAKHPQPKHRRSACPKGYRRMKVRVS